MSLPHTEIANVVLAQLPQTRRECSVVYLDKQMRPAGSDIEVDYKKVLLDQPTVVGFIDLEPEMNWGHACRYVLVNIESGEHRNIDAHFPPFLRENSSDLIVLFKGNKVPPWAVKKSNQTKSS